MDDRQRTIDLYDAQAERLAARYESISAIPLQAEIRDLLPVAEGESFALDVGAGTGRDAQWLADQGFEVIAIEPAVGMRAQAARLGRASTLRWIDDRLPGLNQTHRLGLMYDVILLFGVWQHLDVPDRKRSFRKLATLMRPGGIFLVSLRHGPAPEDRPMYAVSVGEIEALARSFGLEILRIAPINDNLSRSDVSWTVVCLRMPDDGSGALPLIRGIILADEKSSTYKLGLLRALSRVAEYAPAAAEPVFDEDAVEIPLGLVALYWVRMYLPLIRMGLPQAPNNRGPDGLGFAKKGFRSLLELGVASQDLRVGALFSQSMGRAVSAAIGEAAATIARMPANFIRFPNSTVPVFEASRESASRPWGEFVLDLHALRSWGYLRAPGSVWRAMSRLGSWIEPVLISEWCRLVRRYAERAGIVIAPGVAEAALIWNEPSRETVVGRQAMSRLAARRPIVCVWSGADLDYQTLDVDHCLPWAIWPCGDLWNLMPAQRTINQHHKRDRLPSAKLLSRAKDRILNWWEEAWLSDAALEDRFYREAAAALPLSSAKDVEDVFSGLDWRRLRLRQDQQVPEWDLVSKGS